LLARTNIGRVDLVLKPVPFLYRAKGVVGAVLAGAEHQRF
jgi:hypothetical protein